MQLTTRLVALLLASAVLGASPASAKGTVAEAPHLLVVVVDDWGWYNAGWHAEARDESVRTPNLNALVEEGIELNRHYVHRACTPSRAALQSGRLPVHVLQGELRR